MINNRYRVIKQIGKGVFGLVVSAEDTEKKIIVAIKIMHDKSNLGDPRIREQAMREIEILQFINKVDH